MAEDDDSPQSALKRAREMVQKSGKPMSTENLNRASLALSQGKDTTDFDSKLEAMAEGKPRNRSPISKPNVPKSDAAPTASANTNKPPETAAAGDGERRTADRPAATFNTEPTVNTTGEPVMPMPAPRDRSMRANPQVVSNVEDSLPGTGLGMDLLGERTPGAAPAVPVVEAPAGPVKVPGDDPYGRTAPLPTGGAQAATPPEPGFLPPTNAPMSFQDYLASRGGTQGFVEAEARNPAMGLLLGGRGMNTGAGVAGGARGVSGGLPPGSVSPPGPPAALPAPPLALPSSMGPPIPRGLGTPNAAAPPPVIPLQGGPSQAHLMGKPTMRVPAGSRPTMSPQNENIIANTNALVQALRARGSGARP